MVRKRELAAPKRPKSVWYVLISSQLSSCFGGMFNMFRKLTQWKFAQLAAVWSLKQALKYRRNPSVLVDAFANLFQIGNKTARKCSSELLNANIFSTNNSAFHMGFSDDIAWMQEKSLEIVADNVNNVDMDYMKTIIRYYTALLMCQ